MSAEDHYITELERDNRNLTAEVERLKSALAKSDARLSRQQEWIDAAMGGPVVGFYVYVAEHDNGYVCETEDEYCDDATNHNAEITELIIRPQPLAKERVR